MNFKKGIKDGLAIALGYFPVAFAFGVLAIEKGFPYWFPMSVSISTYTGTGQFAGVEMLFLGASIAELITSMIIINVRYTLMALSLSQKFDPNMKLWQKLLLAFGITDETFGVAITQDKEITFPYFIGLSGLPYLFWVGGTITGALLGNIFPTSVLSAFGIALYAMFIAIIIPPTTKDKGIAILVVISIAFSCLFYFTPYLNKLSNGWVVVIGSIICTIIISLVMPKKKEDINIALGDTNDIDKGDDLLCK
ncbi:MAG: AzlC family ABC transporter permease [Clostridia bacterium]